MATCPSCSAQNHDAALACDVCQHYLPDPTAKPDLMYLSELISVHFPCIGFQDEYSRVPCRKAMALALDIGPAAFRCRACETVYFVYPLVRGVVPLNLAGMAAIDVGWFQLDPSPTSYTELIPGAWAPLYFRMLSARAPQLPRTVLSIKIGDVHNSWTYRQFPNGEELLYHGLWSG